MLTEILLEITINIAPFHKSISHMDFLGPILKFGFFVHETGNICTFGQAEGALWNRKNAEPGTPSKSGCS